MRACETRCLGHLAVRATYVWELESDRKPRGSARAAAAASSSERQRSIFKCAVPVCAMSFFTALSSLFHGAYNVEVVIGDNEPSEAALRRFRKGVLNSGVLPEVRGETACGGWRVGPAAQRGRDSGRAGAGSAAPGFRARGAVLALPFCGLAAAAQTHGLAAQRPAAGCLPTRVLSCCPDLIHCRVQCLSPRHAPQVKRLRYFENTQDIKKRKQSARFKKVFRCVHW